MPVFPSSEGTPTSDARVREFVQLLAGCDRRLYDFVLVLVGNFADADEVVQETKLRLWEQFDNYRAGADFGAWACTIAHYQVLDLRKRQGKAAILSPEFYEAVATETARRSDDEVESRQRALKLCLERLSAADRDLVIRCYDGQSPVKQIAAAAGRTVAATYQLLFRIRAKLYRCIERRLAEEG